jgi:hypothetical protein
MTRGYTMYLSTFDILGSQISANKKKKDNPREFLNKNGFN